MLFRDLYYKKITIDEVERKHDEFNAKMGVLEDYTPRKNKYVEAKSNLLKKFFKIYEGRETITEGFKNGIFPFDYDEAYEERIKFEREEKKKKKKKQVISETKMVLLIIKTYEKNCF